jgi:hypothetical protein
MNEISEKHATMVIASSISCTMGETSAKRIFRIWIDVWIDGFGTGFGLLEMFDYFSGSIFR